MKSIKLTGKSYEGWQFDGKFETAAEIYNWLKDTSKESGVRFADYKLSSNFQESFLEFTALRKSAGKTDGHRLMLVTGDFLLKVGISYEVVKKDWADRYFNVDRSE